MLKSLFKLMILFLSPERSLYQPGVNYEAGISHM